jgi:predicted MPP superfamily phosphohydrolase
LALDLPFQAAALAVAAVTAHFASKKRWDASTTVAVAALAWIVVAGVLASDAFHLMRLAAWLLFVHVPVWLSWFTWRSRRRPESKLAGAVTVLLLVVGGYAFLVEPQWLEHTTIHVTSPRVTEPIRIVVLADLQSDAIGPYEESVFDDIRRLEPDLLLMPGDFLQVYGPARAEQVAKVRALLQTVNPRLGSWAVQGNVDPDDYGELFEGTAVRHFTATQTVRLGNGVMLTGLSLRDSFDPALSLPAAESSDFHIVMGHAPDFSLGPPVGDLLLAGHTHGGQVRLPFIGPLLTLSSVPRAWAAGRTELPGGRTLLVSRGVGMERGHAPRLRFLCRPQLLVVDVVRASSR